MPEKLAEQLQGHGELGQPLLAPGEQRPGGLLFPAQLPLSHQPRELRLEVVQAHEERAQRQADEGGELRRARLRVGVNAGVEQHHLHHRLGEELARLLRLEAPRGDPAHPAAHPARRHHEGALALQRRDQGLARDEVEALLERHHPFVAGVRRADAAAGQVPPLGARGQPGGGGGRRTHAGGGHHHHGDVVEAQLGQGALELPDEVRTDAQLELDVHVAHSAAVAGTTMPPSSACSNSSDSSFIERLWKWIFVGERCRTPQDWMWIRSLRVRELTRLRCDRGGTAASHRAPRPGS